MSLIGDCYVIIGSLNITLTSLFITSGSRGGSQTQEKKNLVDRALKKNEARTLTTALMSSMTTEPGCATL